MCKMHELYGYWGTQYSWKLFNNLDNIDNISNLSAYACHNQHQVYVDKLYFTSAYNFI